MRLCYSRKLFMMAFPAQTQEAFFEGHVQAFHYFGGVPHRITYDNLKAAVRKLLEGHRSGGTSRLCRLAQPLPVRELLLHAG